MKWWWRGEHVRPCREGAKYAARLRDAANEAGCASRVLLKTDLAAGHFSATDRYHYFKERAFEHGFILDSLGLCDAEPSWKKHQEEDGDDVGDGDGVKK